MTYAGVVLGVIIYVLTHQYDEQCLIHTHKNLKVKTEPKINFQTDENPKTENALWIIKKCTKVADTVNNKLNVI